MKLWGKQFPPLWHVLLMEESHRLSSETCCNGLMTIFLNGHQTHQHHASSLMVTPLDWSFHFYLMSLMLTTGGTHLLVHLMGPPFGRSEILLNRMGALKCTSMTTRICCWIKRESLTLKQRRDKVPYGTVVFWYKNRDLYVTAVCRTAVTKSSQPRMGL